MKCTTMLPAPDQADVYVIHGCSRLALRRATGLLGRLRRLRWLAPTTCCGQPMLPPAGPQPDATAVQHCASCAAADAFDDESAYELLALARTAFHPDAPRPSGVIPLVDEASALLNASASRSATACLTRRLEIEAFRSAPIILPESRGRWHLPPTNTRSEQ